MLEFSEPILPGLSCFEILILRDIVPSDYLCRLKFLEIVSLPVDKEYPEPQRRTQGIKGIYANSSSLREARGKLTHSVEAGVGYEEGCKRD